MKRNAACLLQLTKEVKEDMRKYHIPYVDMEFQLNSRLSSSLGRCIYKNKKVIRLELQTYFFLHGNESDIRNTICHELIHSSTLCGHTGLWAQYAHQMNQHGYDIHRTSSIQLHPQVYKYEAYCPICGQSWKRKTKSELIVHPQKWRCRQCRVPLKSRKLS